MILNFAVATLMVGLTVTAFLISVTGRMRSFEHDWLEHPGRK